MRSEIMRLVINWLLHLFDVLFIVEIFRLPHCIQQCAIHEFYILLMASATVKKHTFCTANVTI